MTATDMNSHRRRDRKMRTRSVFVDPTFEDRMRHYLPHVPLINPDPPLTDEQRCENASCPCEWCRP